jgi:hypothetical protein
MTDGAGFLRTRASHFISMKRESNAGWLASESPLAQIDFSSLRYNPLL